jgi:hypothetical protein
MMTLSAALARGLVAGPLRKSCFEHWPSCSALWQDYAGAMGGGVRLIVGRGGMGGMGRGGAGWDGRCSCSMNSGSA